MPAAPLLVDTTLREGEQFAGAAFTTEQKIAIARMLDQFGVAYIEHTSPAASPRSAADLATLTRLGLRARVLTHIRCHMDDARLAVESGVQGVNLLFATSEPLRRASHGRSIDQIIAGARAVITFLQGYDLEIRFSAEDTFRTSLDDLLAVYSAVDALGITRIGLADTVGIATPRQVYEVVRQVRAAVRADIEFHGHNDSGCAIANALCAWEGGATHIDVTVLGIGERNGIAALSGMVARLATIDPLLVAGYRLDMLPQIDRAVAEMLGLAIPFNAPISGATAFTHKAGLHTRAVLADPRSYEVLDPAAFGLRRTIEIAHHLTGWHAVAERARELGIPIGEAQARAAARRLKELADTRHLTPEDVDELLYEYAE